ncbi:hypothetical protein PR048_033767 [Dryococelus australis]|uniref:Integrase catalytic domain-containing protein n=1 Tax=Dryococelus australis TaxID=614101 RepID=A0ABQ9G396_9NEOP|nr:hypothetical protein PR048_033767 [Dryococelus australis]
MTERRQPDVAEALHRPLEQMITKSLATGRYSQEPLTSKSCRKLHISGLARERLGSYPVPCAAPVIDIHHLQRLHYSDHGDSARVQLFSSVATAAECGWARAVNRIRITFCRSSMKRALINCHLRRGMKPTFDFKQIQDARDCRTKMSGRRVVRSCCLRCVVCRDPSEPDTASGLKVQLETSLISLNHEQESVLLRIPELLVDIKQRKAKYRQLHKSISELHAVQGQEFLLHIDASDFALGFHLLQLDNQEIEKTIARSNRTMSSAENAIARANRTMTPAEKNYTQFMEDVGKPRSILSDNGSQFTCHLCQYALRKLQISPTTSSISHPQSHPAERRMSAFCTALRKYFHHARQEWSNKSWYFACDRLALTEREQTRDYNEERMFEWELEGVYGTFGREYKAEKELKERGNGRSPENPPNGSIVRHDTQVRKSEGDYAWNITHFDLMGVGDLSVLGAEPGELAPVQAHGYLTAAHSLPWASTLLVEISLAPVATECASEPQVVCRADI